MSDQHTSATVPPQITINDFDEHRFWRWTICAVLASALLRARFCFTALAPDESGALAVSRAWAHGQRLYTDVWVDRPQGIVLLARGWDWLSDGNNSSLRILAIVFGASAVVGSALVARQLSGRQEAGAVAAWLAAVLGSSPAIEGFTANGELLTAGFTVVGLAIGAMVITGRLASRWMLLVGALTGLALSMKQSGYDTFVALGAWCALAFAFRWRKRQQLVADVACLCAGLAVVLGTLAAHGATFGWHEWWYTVVGFRLGERSAVNGTEWHRLGYTSLVALPLFVPVVWMAWSARRGDGLRRGGAPRRRTALLVLWFMAGAVAFLTGGQFHRHYWITLVFPLAASAGMAIARSTRFAADPKRAVAVTLALPLAISAVLIIAPRLERDSRIDADQRLAAWMGDGHADSGETMYVLCTGASFYGTAHQDPSYPYLWFDHVRSADGATDLLVQYLSTADAAPTYVALYQTPALCDPSGRVEAVLENYYAPFTNVAGHEVLRRIER